MNADGPDYSQLIADRQILLGTPIDDRSAQGVIAKLLFLQAVNGKAPVTLYINSPGGSVTASLAIIDAILGLSAPVHTFAMSHCAGMALLILAVGRAGKRVAVPDAILSIEPIRCGESVPHGQAEFYLEKVKKRMVRLMMEQTKLTAKEAIKTLRQGRYFSAQEALALGIVDSLVVPKK